VFDVDLSARQRSQQVYFSVVEEIVVFALESGVRLLFNLKYHIASEDARHLVTLTAEFDFVTTLDSSIDVDMKHLTLHNRLLAYAALASISLTDGFSFALAVWADCLEALDHRAHLTHHGLHTRTVATSTGLDRTLFASTAIALRANDRLLESEFGDFAFVDVFERHLVDVVDGSGFLGSLFAHASSEHAPEG
jgi:hypothetical protein